MLAGVLLGVVNAVVRPIAVILTFPFTVLTLGLFLLVVNAAMLGLVALLLPGFHINGFWAAFLAALIVSITGWIGSMLFGSQREGRVLSPQGLRRRRSRSVPAARVASPTFRSDTTGTASPASSASRASRRTGTPPAARSASSPLAQPR